MRGGAEGEQVGSPQLMRRLNARRVLDHVWSGEPVTASELIRETGLTRATVLDLCRELADQGWLGVLENSRRAGTYTKGRPALRYAFRRDACHVIGVDAGQHRISASVADLGGREIGHGERAFEPGRFDPDRQSGQERRKEVLTAIDSALDDAGLIPGDVGAVVLGVPAPVDAEGRSPVGLNRFWEQSNPDLVTLGVERGWACVVENDANLAALAELDTGGAEADSSFAALLAGERFGAGLVLRGELLRQPRGGAGELGMLELVNGVESPEALGHWARHHAREALASGGGGALAAYGQDEVQAEHVFAAARDGDPLAVEIVDRLADRLARICVVLVGLLDLDRIVLSGAVAPALSGLVEAARATFAEYLYAPWLDITVSELGADAVRTGAVRCAVEQVHARALQGDHVSALLPREA
ncbi:ROK family transcriptional regulator [Nocardiopsis sp. HNM0947]|uniref:ROK family transcriptional regulator n=1 Tax=Nocardiopsis coralli TaxID=2772213 RepID=A0ABR9PA01_9ACTN|nr:ROK family transcriptional regulator [Nocardiopsis coralli]MBE3000666.1 ROK family transcriptional regulator [Nocardiopsis coralli]